jgi:hypothetical protein
MSDGRPDPNIWGNIITCCEIAIGIYKIIGEHKKGLMVPKAVAEEILPESVIAQAEKDGDNLCFTDELSASMVADELIKQELVTDPEAISQLDAMKQLEDIELDTGF